VKTRKPLIIILVLVLLVVYYLVGTDYLKQRRQHRSLASQITETTQILALVPLPPVDLGSRLAAAQGDLEAIKSSFPSYTNSTSIINTVLRLAVEIGVKAIPLVTQPWTTEDVKGQDYSVFRLNLAVTGTFTQLTDFLSRLETGKPETLVIEDLSVGNASEASGVGSDGGDRTAVNASLRIAIYALPSATN
jgi:Tfp pilus assembly protein PilO